MAKNLPSGKPNHLSRRATLRSDRRFRWAGQGGGDRGAPFARSRPASQVPCGELSLSHLGERIRRPTIGTMMAAKIALRRFG